MAKIETVEVRRGNNKAIINLVDFVKGKDVLWTDKVEEPEIIEETPVEAEAEETPVEAEAEETRIIEENEDTEPEKKVLKKKLLKK